WGNTSCRDEERSGDDARTKSTNLGRTVSGLPHQSAQIAAFAHRTQTLRNVGSPGNRGFPLSWAAWQRGAARRRSAPEKHSKGRVPSRALVEKPPSRLQRIPCGLRRPPN